MKDTGRIRADFPLLKKFIYLDSGTVTLTPKPIVESINEFMPEYNSTKKRGVHQLGILATYHIERSRKIVVEFLGSKSDEIIFTFNTCHSTNQVAYSLKFKGKQKIIVSNLNHHNTLVWWIRAAGEDMISRNKQIAQELAQNILIRYVIVTSSPP